MSRRPPWSLRRRPATSMPARPAATDRRPSPRRPAGRPRRRRPRSLRAALGLDRRKREPLDVRGHGQVTHNQCRREHVGPGRSVTAAPTLPGGELKAYRPAASVWTARPFDPPAFVMRTHAPATGSPVPRSRTIPSTRTAFPAAAPLARSPSSLGASSGALGISRVGHDRTLAVPAVPVKADDRLGRTRRRPVDQRVGERGIDEPVLADFLGGDRPLDFPGDGLERPSRRGLEAQDVVPADDVRPLDPTRGPASRRPPRGVVVVQVWARPAAAPGPPSGAAGRLPSWRAARPRTARPSGRGRPRID